MSNMGFPYRCRRGEGARVVGEDVLGGLGVGGGCGGMLGLVGIAYGRCILLLDVVEVP